MLLIEGGITEVPELPVRWKEIKCSSWDAGIPKQLQWNCALPGGRELLSLLWCSWHFLWVFIIPDPSYAAAELEDISQRNYSKNFSPHVSEILLRCGLLAVLGFGVGLKGQQTIYVKVIVAFNYSFSNCLHHTDPQQLPVCHWILELREILGSVEIR